jgi:predicted RNase H-like nuclease (RuvC/YqgF family)
MDINKIVEKDNAIRSLNSDLARKAETVDDLKKKLMSLLGKEKMNGMPTNTEMVEQLSSMLKCKETQVEQQAT